MCNFKELEFYLWDVTTFLCRKMTETITGVVQNDMKLQNTQLKTCAAPGLTKYDSAIQKRVTMIN